ncbi:MAG: DUF5615 family PIN-like protein [Pseudomonadota bacterium]
MKVAIDENLSPKIAKSLRALFEGEHEVVHIRERFGIGISDLEWISQLTREGTWVIISGDRRITRNRVEYAAFRDSRLVGFFLSKGLYKSSVVKQLERLLALWAAIETQAGIVEGGAMFELQSKSTKLTQLKIK